MKNIHCLSFFAGNAKSAIFILCLQLIFLFASCTNPKDKEALQSIVNDYGGSHTLSRGYIKTNQQEKLNGKYIQVKSENLLALFYKANTDLSIPASKFAYLIYKSTYKAIPEYDFIRIIIRSSNGEETYEFSVVDIATFDNNRTRLREVLDILQSKNCINHSEHFDESVFNPSNISLVCEKFSQYNFAQSNKSFVRGFKVIKENPKELKVYLAVKGDSRYENIQIGIALGRIKHFILGIALS